MSGFPLNPNERALHITEAVRTSMENQQSTVHTSMPGIIQSFDPKTQTATVQPVIQSIYTDPTDGNRYNFPIPVLKDVPVHFPAGGGYGMTFPVQKGDECLISFQERSIDNWHQLGGVQPQTAMRKHDYSDAIVHVGLRSTPNVPSNISTTTVQLRSDDGTRFFEIDSQNDLARIVVGQTELVVDNRHHKIWWTSQGDITISAAGTILLQANAIQMVQGGAIPPS